MTYIVIENKKEIPVAAIWMLGATDKKSDALIGQFGSGMKYAIAAALRKGIEPIITTGKMKIIFTSAPVDLGRGSVLAIVSQIGRRKETRDWTTELGKHDWKDRPDENISIEWMILREFYSNALDEEQYPQIYEVEKVRAEKGMTKIYLPANDALRQIARNLGDYFLQEARRIPISGTATGAVYHRTGKGKIYNRGVFVRSSPRETLYDYDFINLPITESRTINPWDLQNHIAKLILEAPRNLLEDVLQRLSGENGYKFLEHGIDSWQYKGEFADEQLEWLGEICQSGKSGKCVVTHSMPAGLRTKIRDQLPKPLKTDAEKIIEKVDAFIRILDPGIDVDIKITATDSGAKTAWGRYNQSITVQNHIDLTVLNHRKVLIDAWLHYVGRGIDDRMLCAIETLAALTRSDVPL
jgi:hypothetical protein